MSLGISAIVVFLLLEILLIWLHKKHYSFNLRVMVSLLLGICFGLGLQLITGDVQAESIKTALPVMKLFGQGYIALLKMLVIPLVMTSIVAAILRLGNLGGQVLNRLAFLSVGMLLGMTALSAGIGLTIGNWLSIGQGLSLPSGHFTPSHHYTGFVDTLLGMLPNNPVAMMANENTVAIVIFAVFIGVAAAILMKTDEAMVSPFKHFMESAFQVTKKLAKLIIGLTPYGVLGLMAQETAHQGFDTLYSVLDFIGAMYLSVALVMVMHTVFLLLSGENPLHYYKKAYQTLVVAFTTRSSFGTLPVTEETLKNKFKLPQISASFVPSMGATLGMNACAGVFPAMLVAMAAQILHQPITPMLFISVMFINAIASLGVSGIPGTAFVAAAVTLTTLGFPYAIVGLVQGIDPIIDMGRTATNVNGVMTTAIITNKVMHYEEPAT